MKTQKNNRKIWEKPSVTALSVNKETAKNTSPTEGVTVNQNKKINS